MDDVVDNVPNRHQRDIRTTAKTVTAVQPSAPDTLEPVDLTAFTSKLFSYYIKKILFIF
jgi:hypothetical protein